MTAKGRFYAKTPASFLAGVFAFLLLSSLTATRYGILHYLPLFLQSQVRHSGSTSPAATGSIQA